MKHPFILLLFLFPAILFAQTNTGGPDETPQPPDYKRDGLFQALFHAGLNGAQIDGDYQVGYYKFGLDAGVGVLVRFHKYFSVSMLVDYSMKGAMQSLALHKGPLDHYQVQWDYVEVPILLSIHDKNIIMFSVGPQIGFMVRYKEYNSLGQNLTDSIGNKNSSGQYIVNPYYGTPNRLDLQAVAMIHFLIKKHFGIGLKFSYSMLKVRNAVPGNGFHGEYNNVLTLQFMYILSTVKKK